MTTADDEHSRSGESKSEGSRSGPRFSSVDQYIVKDPERFALNLARMIEQAGKAAAAWAGPRESGERRDVAAEPLADMVKTFSSLTEYWLSDPSRALSAQTSLLSGYMDIWTRAVRRMADGEAASERAEGRPDKRFQDPEWADNAFFDFLRQTYLVTTKWANDLVEHADGLDEHTRRKAGFYVKQVAEAISPSNFILTNPELFRETVASNGENLVRGMRMLAEDIGAGGGELKLRQVDYSKFEVGRNIAVTPGKVAAKSGLAEIIQYAPTTETALKRPLVIVPPWINKFYILDLNPEKSFIRWAVEQGHTVFVISWINPDERHRDKGWEAYINEGVRLALDTAEAETGEREVNAVGYCVGGTLLAAALALFAQEGETRIRTATFLTTQVDFTYAGDLKVFVDEDQVTALEQTMRETGYLEGGKMATAFNMLRSGDLIWPYIVNNYMRGKEPLPFDLLYWNADCTRMTAANHSYYLRNCYLDNKLSHGEMVLAGTKLSLADIRIPIFNQASREDHIAPARSVFHGGRFFDGDVEFVMAGSGHIAGVVNPPRMKKYQYWTGGKPEGTLEDWLASATEHPGSWWPYWQAWIERHDASRVKARQPAATRKPLGDAPGAYVKVRA